MVKTNEDGRFCESCGERHDRVAVFCPSCGRELGKSLGSKDDSRSLESAKQGKSAGKRRTQLLAASAFGVAIALGGGIFSLVETKALKFWLLKPLASALSTVVT